MYHQRRIDNEKRRARLAFFVLELFPYIMQCSVSCYILKNGLSNKYCNNKRNPPVFTRTELLLLKQLPNVQNFTVQLCYKLISLEELLPSPSCGWGIFPDSKAVKVEDDIERIRHVINDIIALNSDQSTEHYLGKFLYKLEQIIQRFQIALGNVTIFQTYQSLLIQNINTAVVLAELKNVGVIVSDVHHTKLQDRERYSKISAVITEFFPKILRNLIPSRVTPSTLHTMCTMSRCTWDKPQKVQIQKLQSSLSYESLDTSMLYQLFKRFQFVVKDPTRGWGKEPFKCDIRIADDIERIRLFRNKTAHRCNTCIDQTDFDNYFVQFREITQRIAADYEHELTAIADDSLDPKKQTQLTESLQELEDIKERFKKFPVTYYWGNDFDEKIKDIRQMVQSRKDIQGKETTIVEKLIIKIDLQDIIYAEKKEQILNELKKDINDGDFQIEFIGAVTGSLIIYAYTSTKALTTDENLQTELSSFMSRIFYQGKFEIPPSQWIDAVIFPVADNKELTSSTTKSLSLQFSVNMDVFETDAKFESEIGDCMQRTIKNLNGKGFTEDVIAIVDYMQSDDTDDTLDMETCQFVPVDKIESTVVSGSFDKDDTEDTLYMENSQLVPVDKMVAIDKEITDVSWSFEEGPCNIKEDMIVKHFMETTKLVELTSKMERENVAVLSGLAGCGKTQLALTFACNFRKDHIDSICWRLFCNNEISLMYSFKKLADKLGIENISLHKENIDNQDYLNELRELIQLELSKQMYGPNLIMLHYVTDETKTQCQKLKDALLKLEVKVIVTTWDSTFCDTENVIIVNGFSDDEAVTFLQNKKKELSSKEVKNYKKLAQMLSHLPLLLYGARSCLSSSNETASNFSKKLQSISEPSKNRDVFKILKEYLEIVKNDNDEDVFDMMQALQFFALEDIPVLLFDFFPSRKPNHEGLHTTNFIQAIKKFSFGIVRGTDDDQFITIHYAIVKTIGESMSDEEKAKLIKNTLTAFMWLMDKDNYTSNDYKRNCRLLPHALSVLQHVKKLRVGHLNLLCDFESNVLLAYVNDIVGYTYNFLGILKNDGEHSTAAKEACFAILGKSEEEIEKQVMQKCCRDDHHRTWEIFAEKEADIIFNQIKAQIDDDYKKELLGKMAKQFALNKYRGQDHINELEEYLENVLEEKYHLTESEYKDLCKRRLALPEDQIGGIFLFELVLQVFYTYGRNVFYLGDAYQKDMARSFTHSLFLAKALGQRIASEYPEWKILYVMLTELSGTLQLRFEDKADLQLKTLENLEDAAEQLKRLLEYNSETFNYGVIKSRPNNARHVYICYRRLVQCHISMTETTSIIAKLREIHEKIEKYKTTLNVTPCSHKPVTAAKLRLDEFAFCRGNYDDAEMTNNFNLKRDRLTDERRDRKT